MLIPLSRDFGNHWLTTWVVTDTLALQAGGSRYAALSQQELAMQNKLQAVVYLSHARSALTQLQIDALLNSAREFNASHGVTGLLLYGDGAFFQYFEGETKNLEQVYERIRHSSLHYGILELMQQPIAERAFPHWGMGFCDAPRSELTRLSQAKWFHDLNELQRAKKNTPGVDMLLDYWYRVRQMAI